MFPHEEIRACKCSHCLGVSCTIPPSPLFILCVILSCLLACCLSVFVAVMLCKLKKLKKTNKEKNQYEV